MKASDLINQLKNMIDKTGIDPEIYISATIQGVSCFSPITSLCINGKVVQLNEETFDALCHGGVL